MTLEELGNALQSISERLTAVQADVKDLRREIESAQSDNERSSLQLRHRFEELEAMSTRHVDALYNNSGRNADVWPAAAPVHVYNEGIRGFGYEH